MDKPIEKKPRSTNQWVVIGAVALVALFVVWQVFSRSGSSRLRIDSTRITTGIVGQGTFREYYPFDGSVEPFTSVYLDIEEGGRVEKIFAEGGAHVEKGDLILRFSNAQAQRTSIETETRLLETLDTNRNTEFNSARSQPAAAGSPAGPGPRDHRRAGEVQSLRRADEDARTARSRGNSTRPRATSSTTSRSGACCWRSASGRKTSSAPTSSQQAKKSIVRLNENMELLNRIVQSLEVRAPISGYLSTIDAQVGQNINRGQRIGQIDLLDKFKIRARIDQLYISRVVVDTPGHVTLDGKSWDVKVQKVYPEVKNSLFEADIVFTDAVPDSLKRGQTVTVELSFGAPSQTLIVSKGGYYQQTGGRWVYLVSKDGKSAHRTDVKLGRQNPRQVEVLEGLTDGDRIITSGYDSYNNADELKFSEAIKTTQEKK